MHVQFVRLAIKHSSTQVEDQGERVLKVSLLLLREGPMSRAYIGLSFIEFFTCLQKSNLDRD